MHNVASIGTCLPCWGTPARRVAGDDEDAVNNPKARLRFEITEVHDFFTGIEPISYEDSERIALAHNIGGPTAGSAVTLLEGPGANGS